jgi:probable phosphoglycerate mutase
MHLYFIRHGQSYVNLKDWQQGNVDMGLTELGQRQAAALAAWAPDNLPKPDVIYASTMSRARETAQAVAGAFQANIFFDDRLREIGNNRLDHTPFPNDDLPKNYADHWASSRPYAPIVYRDDLGESYMHFRTRVGAFIEDIVGLHAGKTVLAVCHGGVVEAAFDHIFNIGPWRRCEIWDHNTGITYFEFVKHPDRETWRLHYHSRIDHLVGVA